MLTYSIESISNDLNVSTTTVQEVRRKLKISGYTNENGYKRIERFINDVRKQEGGTSLSHINRFLIFHNLEDY